MNATQARALRAGIVLDRDGTLIDVVRDEETGSISVAFHPDQIRFLPGVIPGLRALADAGFVLGIATNQPGPAKGQFSRAAVDRTHAALLARLALEGIPIAAIEVCCHHPTGASGGDASLVRSCECRKPKPGLLNALIEELGLDRERTVMVGDSESDLLAARAAGVRAALVFSTQRCELCPLRSGPPGAPDFVAARFDEIAAQIVADQRRRE